MKKLVGIKVLGVYVGLYWYKDWVWSIVRHHISLGPIEFMWLRED